MKKSVNKSIKPVSPKVTALQEKLTQIKNWTPRLQKLVELKEKQGISGYSETRFCAEHGISQSMFSRWKRCWEAEDAYEPKQEAMDRIEAALQSEGV